MKEAALTKYIRVQDDQETISEKKYIIGPYVEFKRKGFDKLSIFLSYKETARFNAFCSGFFLGIILNVGIITFNIEHFDIFLVLNILMVTNICIIIFTFFLWFMLRDYTKFFVFDRIKSNFIVKVHLFWNIKKEYDFSDINIIECLKDRRGAIYLYILIYGNKKVKLIKTSMEEQCIDYSNELQDFLKVSCLFPKKGKDSEKPWYDEKYVIDGKLKN